MNFRYVLLAVCSIAVAGVCSAADPGQVGTWAGSLKTKVRSASGTTSVKQAMQLEIAADDATTITLDGVVQTGGGGAYAVGEALLVFPDPSAAPNSKVTYAVAHFKGTKVKGATSGITVNGSSELLEAFSGKFSLKKQ
jgi:hypothetical protein